MLVKVNRDDILEGVLRAGNIIPAKTGAAFLRTIWLHAEDGLLRITATDSNLEFLGEYPAEVKEAGLAGVQGKYFCDLIKKIEGGTITFRLDAKNQSLRVEQGRRRYKLPVNEPSWFQHLSPFPQESIHNVSGMLLQDVIDRVVYCVSDEDSMEAAACMSLKPVPESSRVEASGLNGHQFALYSVDSPELAALVGETGMLLQKKYLLECRKWLPAGNVDLAIDAKRLFLRSSEARECFSLPLSYYQFPEYHSFLTSLDTPDAATVVIDRSEALGVLDRMLLFNSENNRCTYFEYDNGSLVLFSQGQDVGSGNEMIEAELTGTFVKTAFPTRDVITIFNHYGSDRLTLTLTGQEGPCGVSGADDPDYTVIIMPMKIVEETYYSEEEA